jgi:hypothetical protein
MGPPSLQNDLEDYWVSIVEWILDFSAIVKPAYINSRVSRIGKLIFTVYHTHYLAPQGDSFFFSNYYWGNFYKNDFISEAKDVGVFSLSSFFLHGLCLQLG